MWILDKGCSTSHGNSFGDFWQGLTFGKMAQSTQSDLGQSHLWANQNLSFKQKINEELDRAIQPLLSRLSDLDGKLGIILASTKGFVEEVVWGEGVSSRDPIAWVLEDFLNRHSLMAHKKICVSNACASSHAAYFLARRWLVRQEVDHVLVLSVDGVGPFVWKGFCSLGLIGSKPATPFSSERSGLQLGEAAVALLLSQKIKSDFKISAVAIDSEGSPVSRPSVSGRSLKRCLDQVLENTNGLAEVVIAHGTGTVINDQIEDQVLSHIKSANKKSPLITSCKWSLGHTLGASGAVDLLAAIGILQEQKVFPIAVTKDKDPDFLCDYLLGDIGLQKISAEKVLVSSLGFGGTHGALVVERER